MGRLSSLPIFFHGDNSKTKYSTPVVKELIRRKKAVEYSTK